MKPGSNFKYIPTDNDPNLYLLNAFSINMIPLESPEEWGSIYIKRIDIDTARAVIAGRKNAGWNIISAIGHQSTAQVMSTLLGIEIPVNRIAVKLAEGDEAIVFQVLERLPEGKVLSKEEIEMLMRQGKIAFYFVRIERVANPFK